MYMYSYDVRFESPFRRRENPFGLQLRQTLFFLNDDTGVPAPVSQCVRGGTRPANSHLNLLSMNPFLFYLVTESSPLFFVSRPVLSWALPSHSVYIDNEYKKEKDLHVFCFCFAPEIHNEPNGAALWVVSWWSRKIGTTRVRSSEFLYRIKLVYMCVYCIVYSSVTLCMWKWYHIYHQHHQA